MLTHTQLMFRLLIYTLPLRLVSQRATMGLFLRLFTAVYPCTDCRDDFQVRPTTLRMKLQIPCLFAASRASDSLDTGSGRKILVNCHGTGAWHGIFTPSAGNGRIPGCSFILSVAMAKCVCMLDHMLHTTPPPPRGILRNPCGDRRLAPQRGKA